jgi:hypothetical protein
MVRNPDLSDRKLAKTSEKLKTKVTLGKTREAVLSCIL